MSLRIEYRQESYQAKRKQIIAANDNLNNIYLRAHQEGDRYFVSISNAKPEGGKNGPGYRQIGFYMDRNGPPVTETFICRGDLIPIVVTTK